MTTSDIGTLIENIAQTTRDYPRGEDNICTRRELVKRWISQFREEVRPGILQELDHVLTHTYYSRERTLSVLSKLVKLVEKEKKVIAGEEFWKAVKFLEIQSKGQSQKEMRKLFGEVLKREYGGLEINDCGNVNPVTFVYIDDAIFSGGRMKEDLTNWLNNKETPCNVSILVIVMVQHTSSSYNVGKVETVARTKGITLKFFCESLYEDRKEHINESNSVLRPVWSEENYDCVVKAKVKECIWREPDKIATSGIESLNDNNELERSHSIFSGEDGRVLLENEFLKAGVLIGIKYQEKALERGKTQKTPMPPLGNTGLGTIGFGSLIVTFRNCPNNAPLALWGDLDLGWRDGYWYPLFPRRTNAMN